MSNQTLKYSSLVLALFAVYPSLGNAAAPTSGAYVTDITDQYVEDEASRVLGDANTVLCYMNEMNPDAMVNKGPYVALLNPSKCNSNAGGGKQSNQGKSLEKAIVDSTQATDAPLIAKVWDKNHWGVITAKASVSQPPSATLPYGEFRIDYCGTSQAATAGSCDQEKGFVSASASGLSYFSTRQDQQVGPTGTANTTVTTTNTLTLNAIDANSGTGALSQSQTGGGSLSISFAYNTTHFLRSDDAGVTPKCFDRALANADRSAWSYGLYDASGARVDRNSGFPIEYKDAAGATFNGYIGYWGLWAEGTAPTSGTVTRIDYNKLDANGQPTRTDFTLLQSGGKLLKHTTVNKKLADVDKQRFWFSPASNVPATGTPVMNSGTSYELYWDNTKGQFMVSGKQSTSTGNMESLATPVAIANADLAAASSWGMSTWTPAGQWSIDSASMATLSSTTPVKLITEDIVYPDQYSAIGGLECVLDCPTPTAAGASSTTFANDFNTLNSTAMTGWTGTGAMPVVSVAAANRKSYKLDTASGNLLDAAAATPILNLTTNYSWSSAFNTQGSGKLVATADFNAIKPATAGQYTAADLDGVATFYTWQSSTNSWDQLSVLKDATGAIVKFDAPLTVDFVVPANVAGTNKPYGNAAGTTISLDYNGFGDLQGIPSSCVDLASNNACDFTVAPTKQANYSWKPDFSIPFDGTIGVVTFTPAGGTLTTYYVKPLSEEVRFKYVGATCPDAALKLPSTTPGLPQASAWNDPAVGTAPTVTGAPRVVEGVVKY